MPKTDKGLAVELTCASIHAWVSTSDGVESLDEEIIKKMLQAAYNAVISLPNGKTREC